MSPSMCGIRVGGHSLDMLENPSCLGLLTTYAIREHNATQRGLHFDYTIGGRDVSACVDFIIPKTLTNVEIKRGDNLPGAGERKLILFQDAHDPIYTFATIGKVFTIPEGEYGAGTWKIIRRGNATVEPHGKGWIFMFDDDRYVVTKFQQDKYLIIHG